MSTRPPEGEGDADDRKRARVDGGDSEALPAGWEVRMSTSKNKPYYFCPATRKTTWERPTEPAPTKAADAGKNSENSQQVKVSHILAKHKDSRRPSSWRQDVITRSKEDALERIKAIRKDIASGSVEFADVARKESDCSSAKRGGDLGFFGRGAMQKPFEDASFALPVKGLSEPISTDSGIHIIYRVA
eukprot:m.132859 g.132859  ORF g.132859 m.132859 type:complete len:188 (+) comp16865_c1_seq2:125-688(+)